MKCKTCEKALTGRQTKFCSRKCRNQSTNFKHQNYQCQQERGRRRKVQLVNNAGGGCSECGYKKNLAALSFHHLDPKLKKFPLDLRQCSNRSMEALLAEAAKCILLCIRCHFELHHPDFEVGLEGLEPPAKEL